MVKGLGGFGGASGAAFGSDRAFPQTLLERELHFSSWTVLWITEIGWKHGFPSFRGLTRRGRGFRRRRQLLAGFT